MSEPREPMSTSAEQPSLFFPGPVERVPRPEPALVQPPSMTATSPLGACAVPYQHYLKVLT
ncbi:MAG TPA: hypothetical protein VGP82_11135, partial [Ktedonobacterales bacterium]|nr:hypothetical protein [Ktedonobacterales bacterium]